MKIKLLAATVLILALATNTTEAQNRQRPGVQDQFGNEGRRNGGFEKNDIRGNTGSYGKRDRDDRNFRSGRMMKNRHSREFNRYDRPNNRFDFQQRRHDRRHRF